MDNNVFGMVIALFGGLGLFLYGMTLMGDGLQNAAGEKLKIFFEKITSNPIKGVLTGAIVTAVIQSSSATTVMVVGFVNAQLMNLYQATAVIMGANIGTTITAQIVTLDLQSVVPIFIGIGACIVLFAKSGNKKEFGHIILGFGILFLGMDVMKDAMLPLQNSAAFHATIAKLSDNMFLGILTGVVMTAIIQSSSAATGILIALSGTGVLSLEVVVPILYGCNIGTCVTAIISSIGTKKNAKRAAIIHLIIKIVGTIIFIPVTQILIKLVVAITPVHVVGGELIKKQIANAHTVFNIGNTIILLPFIKYLVVLANKIIPEDKEELANNDIEGLHYIDERLLESPVIAVGQAVKETCRMGKIAIENLDTSMEILNKNDQGLVSKLYENESVINDLEHKITSFLIELTNKELSPHHNELVTSMFRVVKDIERIGDHAKNITELAQEKIDNNIKFSQEAINELNDIYTYARDSIKDAIDGFEFNSHEKANNVFVIEERIDNLEEALRASHIYRLSKGVCDAVGGALFLDVISNLERVGDHSANIAESILNRKEESLIM